MSWYGDIFLKRFGEWRRLRRVFQRVARRRYWVSRRFFLGRGIRE